MRFMVLVKADKESESGKLPDESMLVEMGKFNDELIDAGVMQAGEGLHPTADGARIKFSGKGKASVANGPFPLTGDTLAGYWVVETDSKQEAIDWFKRAPFERGEIELRQIFEVEEFDSAIKTSEGRDAMQSEREFKERSKH
jgi:hypothetical protein